MRAPLIVEYGTDCCFVLSCELVTTVRQDSLYAFVASERPAPVIAALHARTPNRSLACSACRHFAKLSNDNMKQHSRRTTAYFLDKQRKR